MGFTIFLIVGWIIIVIVRSSAAKAKASQARAQLPPDWFGTHDLPQEHVLRLDGAAEIPALSAVEESTSELMGDETAADHDLHLATSEDVSLEAAEVHAKRVEARPMPGPAASLEAEVDWEAEHERFHHQYIDARAPTLAAAHGLLDDLRDRDAARRAVLMAEILGPPVSLRGPR
jgi:hypothetical protein